MQYNKIIQWIINNLFPIYIGIFFIVLGFFFYKSGILNKKEIPVASKSEVSKDLSGDQEDLLYSTGIVLSGDDEDIIMSDIDNVVDSMNNGVLGEDYVVVSFKPQVKKGSEGSIIDSPFLKDQYLPNNKYLVTIPSNIRGGYLYIKLRKELKFIQGAGVYQPITIWTNIYDTENMRIYGRLNTNETLEVDNNHKEFLYKLDNIPIAGSTTDSWLHKKGQTIQIGGFVGDVSGNGIDKIIFVRQR